MIFYFILFYFIIFIFNLSSSSLLFLFLALEFTRPHRFPLRFLCAEVGDEFNPYVEFEPNRTTMLLQIARDKIKNPVNSLNYDYFQSERPRAFGL